VEVGDFPTSINFTYIPSFDKVIQNATLYHNGSGTWQIEANNMSKIIDGISNGIGEAFANPRFIIWNIRVADNDTYLFANANRSLAVSLNFPELNEELNIDYRIQQNETDEFNPELDSDYYIQQNETDEFNPQIGRYHYNQQNETDEFNPELNTFAFAMTDQPNITRWYINDTTVAVNQTVLMRYVIEDYNPKNTTLFIEDIEVFYNISDSNYTLNDASNKVRNLTNVYHSDEIIGHYIYFIISFSGNMIEGAKNGSAIAWDTSDNYAVGNETNYFYFTWQPPRLLNVTLYPDDGYLHRGEIYKLESYWGGMNMDSAYLNFNFTDGVNNIYFRYYNSTWDAYIEVENYSGYKGKEQNVLTSIASVIEITYDVSNSSVHEISWTFIPENQINDIGNVTIYYYAYNEYAEIQGETNITFKILNLAGGVLYDFVDGSGESGRMIGGDVWELYAKNGNITDSTYAYAETEFRKLNHVHLLAEWKQNNATWNVGTASWNTEDVLQEGYLEYGLDFRYNDTWNEGIKVRLQLTRMKVGSFGVNQDKSWIMIDVQWYYDGSLIKSEQIYSYYHGYYPSGEEQANRTSLDFWVDLWFNKMNSSTVIGGRITPYMYGVHEKGWWGFGDFRPITGERECSNFFYDLEVNNTVISCREFEMIKFWSKIYVDDNTTMYSLEPYRVFDWSFADDRMQGVDTPIYVSPEMPEMKQSGFLAPLYKAISNLGSIIWGGIVGVAKIMIGAIDMLLVAVSGGRIPQGTFARMMQMVTVAITNALANLSYVLSMISYMANIITSLITFISQIIIWLVEGILFILGTPLTIPIMVVNFFLAVIRGESYTLFGIVLDFSPYSELFVGALAIYPTLLGLKFTKWMIYGDKGEVDTDGIPKRILIMFDTIKMSYKRVFWIYTYIRNEAISIYNFIRSHIPTIGGSGGESSEE
jgi:hypothetical protein